MELLYEMDDDLLESFWVRVKGEVIKGDAVVELCYRLLP